MRKLDYYLSLSVLKLVLIICIGFFPCVYLSDIIFGGDFSPLSGLIRMPNRYSQIIHVFCLWGAFLAVRNLRTSCGDITFITFGLKKCFFWRSLMFLSLFFFSFIYFFCIPLNEIVFDEVIKVTSLAVQKKDNDTFFISKTEFGNVIWFVEDGKVSSCGTDVSNKDIEDKCKFNGNYYIIWNEYRKLSFDGLHRCKKYLEKNNYDTSGVRQQWHFYITQCIITIALLLCGFAFGWLNSYSELLFCTVVAHWVRMLVIFFPFPYAVFCLWFNSIFWIIIGLWYLFL